MIASYTHEVTSIRQGLFMAAFSLGYECCAVRGDDDDSGFCNRMDYLLEQLVRDIHPNVYLKLDHEFQRCSNLYDNCSDEEKSSKPLRMFGSFVDRCDNHLRHEPSFGVWYHLGSEIGRACHRARTQHNIDSIRYLLRLFVGLIPDQIRKNDTLNRIAIAIENEPPTTLLMKLITAEIPAECLHYFCDKEKPFQALYKFVTAMIFSSDFESKVEAGTNDRPSINENDARYSDSPPPTDQFVHGPVCGTLNRISQALNMCRKTMKMRHGNWLWIHKLTRNKFHVYFASRERYEYVAGRMTNGSNESE